MKYKGTVYLYNITGARARQIGMLCVRLGLTVRQVEPSRFGEKLGAIAGVPGYEIAGEPFGGEGFTDEMLVMKDFDNQTLDNFLKGFRSMKIPSVPLKAVLTPTNCDWTSVALHDEIRKEHEAVMQQMQQKRSTGEEADENE